MTLQHFLTVGAEDSTADAHCLLGETAWTLRDQSATVSTFQLAQW